MPLPIVFAALLIAASSTAHAIEESTKFHDPRDHERFVQILKQEQIPFRVTPDGQVFYPIEYRDKVRAAADSIHGPANADKEGVKVRPEQGDVVLDYLVTNGIDAEFMIPTNKTVILWPTSQSKKAMALVSEVLRQHGW